MSGLIVTWDQEEIQVIDDGNFESVVVDVVSDFFDTVEGYSEVTVEWRTPTRNHGSVYKVSREPLIHLDRSRCFIDIVGDQQGGEYQLDLKPSGFDIKTLSSGYVEELSFLRLRGPGVAIDTEEKEAFVQNLPESIRERIITPWFND
jgi:hypothetical protein